MIQCDACDAWFHFECVRIQIAPDDDWFCSNCIDSTQLYTYYCYILDLVLYKINTHLLLILSQIHGNWLNKVHDFLNYYIYIYIFFGGGGGGGTKSTRIFCMGMHDILSVWGYQIS